VLIGQSAIEGKKRKGSTNLGFVVDTLGKLEETFLKTRLRKRTAEQDRSATILIDGHGRIGENMRNVLQKGIQKLSMSLPQRLDGEAGQKSP